MFIVYRENSFFFGFFEQHAHIELVMNEKEKKNKREKDDGRLQDIRSRYLIDESVGCENGSISSMFRIERPSKW